MMYHFVWGNHYTLMFDFTNDPLHSLLSFVFQLRFFVWRRVRPVETSCPSIMKKVVMMMTNLTLCVVCDRHVGATLITGRRKHHCLLLFFSQTNSHSTNSRHDLGSWMNINRQVGVYSCEWNDLSSKSLSFFPAHLLHPDADDINTQSGGSSPSGQQ